MLLDHHVSLSLSLSFRFCSSSSTGSTHHSSFPPPSSFELGSFNGWFVFLPHKWHWATFVTRYVGIPLFAIAIGVGRYLSGQGLVRCCFMDFTSGLCLLAEQESESVVGFFPFLSLSSLLSLIGIVLCSSRSEKEDLEAKMAFYFALKRKSS